MPVVIEELQADVEEPRPVERGDDAERREPAALDARAVQELLAREAWRGSRLAAD